MAACGSLQHIFETPLPAENPTLLDSLSSWNQLQPVKPIDNSSFTEIFGELHFNDNSPPSSTSTPVSTTFSSSLAAIGPLSKVNEEIDQKCTPSISKEGSFSSTESKYDRSPKSSDSFSPMNSEKLQLCTEGLGSESSGDLDDSRINDVNEECQIFHEDKVSYTTRPCYRTSSENNYFVGHRRSRSAGVEGFPPPISCISKSGKPWVCFKSYRHDGRFVLKEIRVPTQEFLQAYREGGRLKLHFVHHEDEQIPSEGECKDDDDDDDDGGEEEEEEEDSEEDTDDQDEENGDEEEDGDEDAGADAVKETNEAHLNLQYK